MSDKAIGYEEYLKQTGRLTYTFHGRSMLPLLREGRDLFIVEEPARTPGRRDVILFKRADRYVLHRIVGQDESGYITRGDNNYFEERGIKGEDVLGVMTGYVRAGHEHSVHSPAYICYAYVRVADYPLRRLLHRIIGRLRRLRIRSQASQ